VATLFIIFEKNPKVAAVHGLTALATRGISRGVSSLEVKIYAVSTTSILLHTTASTHGSAPTRVLMSLKRSPPGENGASGHEDIFISEAIHDRKSTFVGYFSPSRPARVLQAFPELKSASHRVAAWRTPSDQSILKSTSTRPSQHKALKTGHDDDGEQWAGKRLEKVLEELDVEGSVVVARWYGGVLLGPVRFNHFEDVATDAIRKWQMRGADHDSLGTKRRRVDVESAGYAELALQGSSPANPATTMRPEDVQRTRDSLIADLQERDNSIAVLRELLEQKKTELPRDSMSPKAPARNPLPTSPNKKPDYSKMTLVRLQALEKARDASIGFLLKEITKVEEEIKRAADEEEAEEEAIDEAWNLFSKEVVESPKEKPVMTILDHGTSDNPGLDTG
jgi:putative IMPACT (imprinted ancient) family translation regulator